VVQDHGRDGAAGDLLMIGGYRSFAAIEGKACASRADRSRLALPVLIGRGRTGWSALQGAGPRRAGAPPSTR